MSNGFLRDSATDALVVTLAGAGPGVLDDFNRDDGVMGGDWSLLPAFNPGGSGNTNFTISSRRLVSAGQGPTDNGFLETSYGPDLTLQVEFNTSYEVGPGDALVFGVRGAGLGDTAWAGPHLVLIGGTTTDEWQLRDHGSGSSTTRDTETTAKLQVSAGEQIGLEATGDQFVAYKILDGVSTEIARMTTNVTTAGQFFFEISPNTGPFDGITGLFGGTVS